MKKTLIFSFLLVVLLSACSQNGANVVKNISIEEAKTKAADFINNNLMAEGQQVSVKEMADENGLYKVVVNMSNGQEITTYLSKDGTKFFPQVMDVVEVSDQAKEVPGDSQAPQDETALRASSKTYAKQITAELEKSNKPKVELFVMSHCPYGTQVEKGVLPVVEALGDKIDFELKFCDYAMHGEKELNEQLAQVCIQENEPEKLTEYLTCFLGSKSGSAEEAAQCVGDLGINKTKLSSCIARTDTKYEVSELFKDETTWKSGRFPQFNINQADVVKYGVSGSPSFVLNGVKVQAQRSPQAMMDTICEVFENRPEECDKEIDINTPSAGFGYSASSGANSAAGCAS